jgi:hypothetical protein
MVVSYHTTWCYNSQYHILSTGIPVTCELEKYDWLQLTVLVEECYLLGCYTVWLL